VATKQAVVVGVLALQGDFLEHFLVLHKLNVAAKLVKTIADCKKTDGLILPGGESTAIGLQLRENGLGAWLRTAIIQKKYPVYGTCAGSILLAKRVDSEFSLKVMDITASRNAYGRQLDSFDEPIESILFKGLRGVFIRAPRITQIAKTVEMLATHGHDKILVRQENMLAGTFHPELTGDLRVHKYFFEMVKTYTQR